MYNLFPTAICLRKKVKLIVSFEDTSSFNITNILEYFAICLSNA